MKHTLWLMALNAAAVLVLFGGLTMGWPVSPVFVEANDVAAAPKPQVSDVAHPLKASTNHHCLRWSPNPGQVAKAALKNYRSGMSVGA